MNALAPIADRLGKLIRMLSSDRDGEVIAATHALRRTLHSAGADIHARAAMIERPEFNETEAKRIYDAGFGAGKREAEKQQAASPPWHDTLENRWQEMALFCQQHVNRLDERHHGFVNDMA